MMLWIYSWIIYPLAIIAASLFGIFSQKTRRTLRLRRWHKHLGFRFGPGTPIRYWIHVASSGELEYAVPIIKEFNERKINVVITYYSISAKSAVEGLHERYPNVSLIAPVPHDGMGRIDEFVSMVKKQGVVAQLLLRYELWPGMLAACKQHKIEVVLVEALRPSFIHRHLVKNLFGILVGFESEKKGIENPRLLTVGDTRVERVMERLAVAQEKIVKLLPGSILTHIATRPVLLLGSMWPKDHSLVVDGLRLLRAARPNLFSNLVVFWVPHELDNKFAKTAAQNFLELGFECRVLDAQTTFEAFQAMPDGPVVFLLMRTGFLAELYSLATAAMVGGGFGLRGVHSVWEPAVAGVPVSCGVNIARSPEARNLIDKDLITVVSSKEEMLNWLIKELEIIHTEEKRRSRTEAAINGHVGAAARVVQFCLSNLEGHSER